ncbi:MAG: ATP-dependent RecD-like DNA helicase [Anaerovoracaceae bacterium]|jgi:exodeoxyribonuclease V alpha subunit
MLEKKGLVTDIIFHNRENSYTIVVIENEEGGERFTAVGSLPGVEKGRYFSLLGDWKVHPIYGEQFTFSEYREEMPTSSEGIEGFLGSGLLKGIGKKTAAAMVRKFGTDTLRIIQEAPERLTEISGIGPVKAKAIEEAFRSHREFAAIVLYFQQFGISAGYAMKLYQAYGSDTIEVVEENPYQLVNDVFGIGFRKADKIAEKMGMDKHSHHRIKSGIMYGLWVYAGEGHTFAPKKAFCEKIGEMLDIPAAEIHDLLVDLVFDGDIHVENIDGREVVFLMPYYLAEQNVCRKLMELSRSHLKPISNHLDRLIMATESKTGMILSENQRNAVKTAVGNGVCVITGGPGTGKTTIINAIIDIFHYSELRTAIAAPTGRAAKRVAETSGYPASTIHRLLEYYYSEGEDLMRFGKNQENLLDYDAIIIDEVSMVDILLMNGLLAAIGPGTRLILVGDGDQLPSVGAGNVLNDIIAGEIIPGVKLTEIFRQARESLIVVNAHRINKGEFPDVNERDKDFFLIHRKSENEMMETIKDLCVRRLPGYFHGCDPVRDVQVLTPVRKGIIGSININKELQAVLNPWNKDKKERKYGDRIFREGDKVMQIKNNYDLEWKCVEDFTEGKGVFNGDCGYIQGIDTEFNEITVVYDEGRYVKYDFAQLDELELAYGITVHKSQGSEFPIIVMPISWFPPVLATRNLLYTAVTRAKDAVILVGSQGRMEAMIENNRIEERYSGLSFRLQEFLEWI